MRKVIAVAYETFLRLKRDRIFLPMTIAGLLLFAVGGAVADWSIDGVERIYSDFAALAYEMLGGIVAIFWGTRTIVDSRQEGSLEVQLAAPISRSSWIVGKFLGLCACLSILAILLILGHTACFGLKFDTLPAPSSYIPFGLMTVGWFVIAAIAIFFSAFTSGPVAIFTSLSLWVTGLVVDPIARILPPDTPAFTRQLLMNLALYFDLNRFRGLASLDPGQVASSTIAMTILQGLSLIGFLLAAACLIFEKRSLVA